MRPSKVRAKSGGGSGVVRVMSFELALDMMDMMMIFVGATRGVEEVVVVVVRVKIFSGCWYGSDGCTVGDLVSMEVGDLTTWCVEGVQLVMGTVLSYTCFVG
jgi:hypothetical protein